MSVENRMQRLIDEADAQAPDGVVLDDRVEVLPPAVNGEQQLSEREEEEYRQDCETIIADLGAFVRVGQALRRIKKKRLYRADFRTFEACVKALFDLAERRAQQLMQTSQVMELLETEIKEKAKNFSPFAKVMPKNESQAAALLRAPEDKRADIWLKAIEKAGDKVTARHVANVIREEGAAELKEMSERAGRQSRKEGSTESEAATRFNEAFRAFSQEISEAYLADWRYISKAEVAKHLQSLIDYINLH